MRPPCMTCMNTTPPRSCTARATSAHPARCSGVSTPACPGNARLVTAGNVPSVTTSPAEARWA